MTDERTIAYLLDELSEHEAQQFEEQCFSQPEWPEVVESAEEDLIQAYIDDQLSPERRRRFQENYLTTPARIERVLFARAFPHVVCPLGRQKPAQTQGVLAFVKSLAFSPQFAVHRVVTTLMVFGLAATGLWFSLRTTPPQTFAHINLAISDDNRSAGASTQKVKLPLPEDALRIWLSLPEPATQGATYRVRWEDKKGPIEDLAVESADVNRISVIIPAGKLTRGPYALQLFRKNPNGIEERVPGNYFFTVD